MTRIDFMVLLFTFLFLQKSNPLTKEGSLSTQSTGKLSKQSAFQERLRAERESFKAVFDRKRQRIGGLDLVEEP